MTTTIHSRADHHRILLTVLTVAAPGEPSSASWLGRAGRWLRGRLTAAGRAERQAAERRAQDWRSLVRLRAASLDADHWVAQVADGTLTATFDHATLPAPEAVAELMAVIAKDE